jgi:hypothetical protein
MGVEPIQRHRQCRVLTHIRISQVAFQGIEPQFSGSKPDVLPLHQKAITNQFFDNTPKEFQHTHGTANNLQCSCEADVILD